MNAPLPRPLAADGIVNIDARGLAQYLWSESNREQIERGGYYGSAPTELKAVNQKLRKAIEDIGSLSRIEGLWWQFSVTERSTLEPSAVSLLRISRDHDRMLEVNGRAWQEDGTLSARYWSEAAKEMKSPTGIFYVWKGERPRHPNAPAIHGTGEIKLEAEDRASGYWTTRSDADSTLNARTSGVYVRAEVDDLAVLDGRDNQARAALIAEKIGDWKLIANS